MTLLALDFDGVLHPGVAAPQLLSLEAGLDLRD